MSDWTTTGALVLGGAAVLYIARRALGGRNSYSLPPGPPGLPWVGNVIEINASAPWITYAEWARTYGDIVYSRLLGEDVIIINSEKVAKDLLEKRSRNYSDRPHLITQDMLGQGFNSAVLPYGDQWKLHRRFFHQTYRLEAVPRFLPLQHCKACQILRQLFDRAEQLDDHVFEYTASVMLNSVYDYDPPSREDKLIDIAANVLNIVIPAVRPDVAIIIDAFPFLRHLPSWLPGMSFKRQMAIARAYTKEYLERPFEYSLQRASSGTATLSMVHDGLKHMQEKGISAEESWMEALMGAAGTAFLDTLLRCLSNAVLMTFFLMMMLNPAAQEKAQAQIDAVVSKTRLPGIADRPLLPFVDAIFREMIRYSPVVPLSIPHAAVDDDVYEGFHVPKGAILFSELVVLMACSSRSMAHDESRYPNPHAFLPERFLNDDGSLKPNDVEHIGFGFGRRMCVGRHYADMSVWAVIVRVLAVFKILKPLDENGIEMSIEPKFSSGLGVHPLPFKCRIVPRFAGMDAEKLEELIGVSTA